LYSQPRRDRVKLLYFEKGGLAIGTSVWRKDFAGPASGNGKSVQLSAELVALLAGVDLAASNGESATSVYCLRFLSGDEKRACPSVLWHEHGCRFSFTPLPETWPCHRDRQLQIRGIAAAQAGADEHYSRTPAAALRPGVKLDPVSSPCSTRPKPDQDSPSACAAEETRCERMSPRADGMRFLRTATETS